MYQFWIHTEHIKKLPKWFEAIFNTPSHHRVHHGRDPKYIDKNYAGVFIIWDRFFGTFQLEEERPNYGITKSLNSWNPVYANFAHYFDLYAELRKVNTFKDGMKILFNRPGWLPDYLGGIQRPTKPKRTYKKYNVHANIPIHIYIFIQFLGALVINAFFFFNVGTFSEYHKILFAIWIILTTLIFGFLFEVSKPWVFVLEALRLLTIPLGVTYLSIFETQAYNWIWGVTLVFSLASLMGLYWLWKKPPYPQKGAAVD